MNKDKLVQIYEVAADLTLDILKKCKDIRDSGQSVLPSENIVDMLRETRYLYETINHVDKAVPKKIECKLDGRTICETCAKEAKEARRG